MKKSILSIEGARVLSKETQKTIMGGAWGKGCNLALCGCDCTGSVTGPSCCASQIACPQIYTC